MVLAHGAKSGAIFMYKCFGTPRLANCTNTPRSYKFNGPRRQRGFNPKPVFRFLRLLRFIAAICSGKLKTSFCGTPLCP
jgi:hypothetical protein